MNGREMLFLVTQTRVEHNLTTEESLRLVSEVLNKDVPDEEKEVGAGAVRILYSRGLREAHAELADKRERSKRQAELDALEGPAERAIRAFNARWNR